MKKTAKKTSSKSVGKSASKSAGKSAGKSKKARRQAKPVRDRRQAATKVIKVDYLARVEGEGALFLKYQRGKVEEVRLKIFEPPRFFEAFLQGRDFSEAPDITSRICGICPVAYQMSAVHAMENAAGVVVPKGIRQLRRLLYCGEWIESHVLHIYMLHAPDFLGVPDVMTMARQYKDEVERGLRQKKRGNLIVKTLGGREIHPINVKVGGFYSLPPWEELARLREELVQGRDEAWATLRFVKGFEFPDFSREVELVSLVNSQEYPMNEGRIRSSTDLDIAAQEFEAHFEEEHIAYSHALFSKRRGRGSYLVGPMARFSLNYPQLSAVARQGADEVGLAPGCQNPFKSILARAVEVLYAFDEAVRLLDNLERPAGPSVPVEFTQAARGAWATEAPRGLLYHRYEIQADGSIKTAQIIPPTSQNQRTIEEDVRELVLAHPELDEDRLRHRCEQAIRNYDPCISCATHFLKIKKEVVA